VRIERSHNEVERVKKMLGVAAVSARGQVPAASYKARAELEQTIGRIPRR
jgi:hypothetical protein